MNLNSFLDGAVAKGPIIAGVTMATAVSGAWYSTAHWPFYTLSIGLILTAAAILVRRLSARVLKTKEQLGFTRNRDLLRFQFFAQGEHRAATTP